MATVDGPLMSLAAHGTYRRQLLYRTYPGGTHVSPPLDQSGPRSLAQTQQATAVSNMAAAWSGLSAADKTLWANCGTTYSLSGYQLFWREWFAQSIVTPALPVNPCP